MWKRIIVIAAVAGLIVGGTASSALGSVGSDPEATPAPTAEPSPSSTGFSLECPEGYVPGWLDENGNPQGCVANGIPNWGETEEPLVADPPVVEKAPSPTPVVATPKFTG